jgi:hypothetical protein
MSNNKYINTLVNLAKSKRFYDCAITVTHLSDATINSTHKPCYTMAEYGECYKCLFSSTARNGRKEIIDTVKILENSP